MRALQAQKCALYKERNDGNYYDIELKRDGDKTPKFDTCKSKNLIQVR